MLCICLLSFMALADKCINVFNVFHSNEFMDVVRSNCRHHPSHISCSYSTHLAQDVQVHIDIIMDKMFEALYIKYNHEAPIHSLKIVILARLNVKMYFPLHSLLHSLYYNWSFCLLLCGCKSLGNPNIFNIISLFGEYRKTHALVFVPNRHAIERKMSSFKLSYNAR